MTEQQRKQLVSLYQQYAEAMYRLTYLRVHDADLARDLVQEVFLAACIKSDDLLSRHEKPGAWLYRALEYQTKQELRRSYHKKELPLLDLNQHITDSWKPLSEILPVGLTGDERDILTWRIEDRMSYEAIAKRCGITVSGCRKRYSRALAHCKKLLLARPKLLFLLLCQDVICRWR